MRVLSQTDFFLVFLKVLVENGTKDGHQMLMEAREALLKVLYCCGEYFYNQTDFFVNVKLN